MLGDKRRLLIVCVLLGFPLNGFSLELLTANTTAPEIVFDHIHTYQEVSDYLDEVVGFYPQLTALHTIGQSYLGKDLLVIEITNQTTGEASSKPGYFIDGNLHSGEVIGGEICLHTIHTLVTGYGDDPFVTELLDTRVFYIMPKLNPDGSDHAINKPDGMRSVVRPFDDDGDGLEDEDPPEDLNGDGYITRIRVRDENGPLKTSTEDPRLMVSRETGSDPADWNGEFRVFSEGIDNDGDGEFNEDGVGGIDINRNFPEQWQPAPVSFNPGPYPLSEIESRAVADFLLSRPNLTGLVNYHMSGNVAVYPPSNLRTDPITGEVLRQPREDELTFGRLGRKAIELIDNAEVQVFKIHGASPATWHGSIWGVYVDWVYYRLGIYAWIFEVGIYPGVTDIFPSYGKESERLRWSDENKDGQLFVDWQPYDHPQLGPVEIGGFLDKVKNPVHGTYTNVMCLPGPDYEKLLDNHTKWHLYLLSVSPLVQIGEIETTHLDGGFYRIRASVENRGGLPTYVSQQALLAETDQPVTATLSLNGATLVGGAASIDLGHLAAGSSSATADWLVQVSGREPTVMITTVSQKGGTDTKTIRLSEN
ncbi:M14 family metallopeptidase [Gemmatimonadota bacterium]